MASVPATSSIEQRRAISPVRVVVATLGLVATGGLLGGLSAILALAVALSVRLNWSWLSDWSILILAGVFGAVLGGVLAPLVSWVFLRDVPIGRAMLRTTLAAALGGAIGGVFLFLSPIIPVVAAVFGFLLEAANLYLHSPRQPADASTGPT